MGISVDWHNADQTIIRYRFEGKWVWDEFYPCWDWVREAMASVDHSVAMIIDMHETHHIPTNSMVHLRAVVQRSNPNYAGITVMIGTGSVGPAISATLYKLNPALREKYQVLFADNLGDAERLLVDWQQQQTQKVNLHDDDPRH
ncbi:MAG: hypothetical protein ABI700_23505 [Chloroflexota bacterium]